MNRRFRRLRSRLQPKRRPQPQRSVAGSFSPPPPNRDWQTFDAELTQLETSVRVLRSRFEQIREYRSGQQQLEQLGSPPTLSPDEVERLQARLDELAGQLEKDLLDWRSLQEPFWQAVRFGGLGIIVGWVLKSLAS